MRNRIGYYLILITAPLIAGCAAKTWSAQPGQYQNYGQALAINIENSLTGPNWNDIPTDVKHRLAECMSDLAIANITPAQRQQRDTAARGHGSVPPEVSQQVEGELKEALGEPQRGDFSKLRPYCPADIPAFQKYVRY
jgi:hypothetical protein